MEWNVTPFGVSYWLAPQVVHILNDQPLRAYLQQGPGYAIEAARFFQQVYQNEYGESLAIGEDSLAIEIIGHVFVGNFSSKADTLFQKAGLKPLDDFVDSVQAHTDIIDCGSKEMDSNRFVWDRLVPVKNLIYKLTQ